MQVVNASSLNWCRFSSTWLPQSLCFGPFQWEVKMKKSSWVLTFLEFLFRGLTVYRYHNMAHNSIQETLLRKQNPTEIVQEIEIPLNIASQTAYSAFSHSAPITRYPLHLLWVHTLPVLQMPTRSTSL